MSLRPPGSEIDGFRLGEALHVGGMAWIYRLMGPDGPLPLVMKVPRLAPGQPAANVISFEVERTVLGALSRSPHVPTLIALGELETTPYLVMEYVEGTSLSDWMPRAPLPAREIARLGAALALALQDLHRQDVSHLDLKPANVLYRASGTAVLVDFGLSRHAHFPDLLAEELRGPIGNWPYMAPEQTVGVRCDPRSDIFALGGILYRLATGHAPWGSPETLRELRTRTYAEPEPPRALVRATPEWLQEIILRCLAIDARERYQSAGDVAFDLTNYSRIALSERGRRSARASWVERLKRRAGARRFKPAPCPPVAERAAPGRMIVVALAPEAGDGSGEPLRQLLRDSARRITAADPDSRLACVTVVPPSAAISGQGEERSAAERQLRRLVALRAWARGLELPEGRVTYHVLEGDRPAAVLIDYATLNEADHVLLGLPRSGTLSGVCAQVVAGAPCSVTVVRPRTTP